MSKKTETNTSTQTTSKPKQLTMSKVKNTAKQIDKKEEYILSTNESIRFNPIFAYDRIIELVKELGQDMVYAAEKNVDIDDELFVEYVHMLCIKYFTSLEKGFAKKFEDKLLQLNYLIKTGYYKEIMDDVFMPNEVQKVFDTITDEINKNRFIEDMFIKANNKLEELKIKNKEIVESIENIKTPSH